jgi:hypothetical protein
MISLTLTYVCKSYLSSMLKSLKATLIKFFSLLTVSLRLFTDFIQWAAVSTCLLSIRVPAQLWSTKSSGQKNSNETSHGTAFVAGCLFVKYSDLLPLEGQSHFFLLKSTKKHFLIFILLKLMI